MVRLRPILSTDADALFPMIYRSAATDTLIWEGPESIEQYREKLADFAAETLCGTRHVFTIEVDGQAAGNISLSPNDEGYRGVIGLWIGAPFQGRGVGTRALGLICEYGFEHLGMERVEACVFVGNCASRRAFEKNGFQFEGTIRRAVLKRGKYLDEWMMGLLRDEWLSRRVQP